MELRWSFVIPDCVEGKGLNVGPDLDISWTGGGLNAGGGSGIMVLITGYWPGSRSSGVCGNGQFLVGISACRLITGSLEGPALDHPASEDAQLLDE